MAYSGKRKLKESEFSSVVGFKLFTLFQKNETITRVQLSKALRENHNNDLKFRAVEVSSILDKMVYHKVLSKTIEKISGKKPREYYKLLDLRCLTLIGQNAGDAAEILELMKKNR